MPRSAMSGPYKLVVEVIRKVEDRRAAKRASADAERYRVPIPRETVSRIPRFASRSSMRRVMRLGI